jgi:DNA-binding winged helix-turn-helix (wHTH) protein/TolB-like protein
MIYIFGVFEFDSSSLELRKSGRTVALEPQPARALSLLLENAGQTVSRDELSANVWGSGTHVDFDRGLAYCMGQVRAALGDSGENSRFVQTLPKRGFKFIAPVSVSGVAPVVARSPRSARWVWSAALMIVLVAGALVVERAIHRSRRPIIAVSVFDNETGDSRYDRAVHALSDTVVDRLTGLGPGRIGIIGNAAVLRMPRSQRDLERIVAETGASHVILAQLQPSKGQLSLLMHLIRLDDGTHLWTGRIPRPSADSLESLGEEAASLIEAGVRAHVLTAQ